MAKGRFGSFYGTAAAGTDMIVEFKKKADLIRKPILICTQFSGHWIKIE